MSKLIIGFCMMLFVFVGITAPPVHAVDVSQEVCNIDGTAKAESPYCRDSDLNGKNPIFGPDGLMTRIIELLSIIVGVAAVIGIMLAGLKFITGGNNPQEIAAARSILIYAVVGLIVAASAQLIVRLFLYQIGES